MQGSDVTMELARHDQCMCHKKHYFISPSTIGVKILIRPLWSQWISWCQPNSGWM